MARPLRPDYTETFHHIVVRGVDGLPIFDQNRKQRQFLTYLQNARKTYDLRVYAFGFLPNHWHAFIRRADGSMARFFQALKSRYAVWYNKTFNRTGTLYDGRYFSSIVEADPYFQKVWCYVQNQGVNAGLYDRPEADPGSTAGLYAGADDRYDWIDWEEALELLDVPSDQTIDDVLRLAEDSPSLPVRRERDQRFIASDGYVERYMQIRQQPVREGPRKETPVSWNTLQSMIDEDSPFTMESILKATKRRMRHKIRCGLAYAARKYGHKSTGEIAAKLNVSTATVSRMIQKVVNELETIKNRWDQKLGKT